MVTQEKSEKTILIVGVFFGVLALCVITLIICCLYWRRQLEKERARGNPKFTCNSDLDRNMSTGATSQIEMWKCSAWKCPGEFIRRRQHLLTIVALGEEPYQPECTPRNNGAILTKEKYWYLIYSVVIDVLQSIEKTLNRFRQLLQLSSLSMLAVKNNILVRYCFWPPASKLDVQYFLTAKVVVSTKGISKTLEISIFCFYH